MEKRFEANVLTFPAETRKEPRPRRDKSRIKNVDGIKYFSAQQIKMLRRRVRDKAELDQQKGNVTAIKEWLVIDLLTSTGLRVSEAANLRCGDLEIGHSQSKIFIRDGKGHISAHIIINDALKTHLRGFKSWKEQQGEDIGTDDFLFIGQRGPWTSQAIQQIVKKYLRELGLYEMGKSVHALRHSYAVELYARSKDLRSVQKQLRHVSIQSTLLYADVSEETIGNQIKGLWN